MAYEAKKDPSTIIKGHMLWEIFFWQDIFESFRINVEEIKKELGKEITVVSFRRIK